MKRRGGKGGGEWSKCYWLTEISSKAFSCSSNPMTDKLNRTRSKIEVHFSSFFTCAGTAGWTPSQCHHQSSSLAVSTVIKKIDRFTKKKKKKKSSLVIPSFKYLQATYSPPLILVNITALHPAESYRLSLELLFHCLDGVSALGQQGLIQMFFGFLISCLNDTNRSKDEDKGKKIM